VKAARITIRQAQLWEGCKLRYFNSFEFFDHTGTRLAIQWDWTVTRKRDHKRATTHDAILVHLVGGKIATWSEYFDFGNSLDAKP
jgi:hypothetical protein